MQDNQIQCLGLSFRIVVYYETILNSLNLVSYIIASNLTRSATAWNAYMDEQEFHSRWQTPNN